jgi:hypothetical protein
VHSRFTLPVPSGLGKICTGFPAGIRQGPQRTVNLRGVFVAECAAMQGRFCGDFREIASNAFGKSGKLLASAAPIAPRSGRSGNNSGASVRFHGFQRRIAESSLP